MVFSIALIVIGVALAVLAITRVLPIKWWIGGAIAAVGLLLTFWEVVTGDGLLSWTLNDTDEPVDPNAVDTCGCQAGEKTILEYKPFWGKRRSSLVPCNVALTSVTKNPNRFSIKGCSLT